MALEEQKIESESGQKDGPAPDPIPEAEKKTKFVFPALFSIKNVKILFIVFGILLLVGILIFVISAQKKPSSTVRTGSANSVDSLLATVGDEKIYKSDVKKLAEEQYASGAIDNSVLKKFFNIAVETSILNQEAKKFGISVKDEEITQAMNSLVSSSSAVASKPGFIKQVRLNLLRNKIINQEIGSRGAYIISVWIPPVTDTSFSQEEKSKFQKQRTDADLALSEAESSLTKKEVPLTIAETLYKEFTSLQPILALNGNLIGKAQDESVFAKPVIYTSDKSMSTEPLYKAIFSLQKINDVKKVFLDNGSGGFVVQLKTMNDSAVKNYDQWLSNKKAEMMKINTAL